MSDPAADADVPLISTEEAIAEVQRWLAEGVEPEGIFAATGDQVIRYKDLIGHLQGGTPDGEMLRFAIARGRLIRRERTAGLQALWSIERQAASVEHHEKQGGERGRAPGTENPEGTADDD